MQAKLEKHAATLSQQAPHWVCLLLVVSGFLYYLDRIDERQSIEANRVDHVAVQRIDACHDVQERAISTMTELTVIAREQNQSLNQLIEIIEGLAKKRFDNHAENH